MKNEFVENDQVNAAIGQIYQAMYAKTDQGVKNGEANLSIVCPSDSKPDFFGEAIRDYFNGIYANPALKKYFISIELQDHQLQINFKWGHHAMVANKIVTHPHQSD